MTRLDYEWPSNWDDLSQKERQQFFAEFRERVYTFWRAQARYEREREERVSNFRVEDDLY